MIFKERMVIFLPYNFYKPTLFSWNNYNKFTLFLKTLNKEEILRFNQKNKICELLYIRAPGSCGSLVILCYKSKIVK